MRSELKLALVLMLLLATTGALLAQAPSSGNGDSQQKAEKWMSFEVMIIAIDSKGEMHQIENFAQGLKFGQKWETTLESAAGNLRVQVTWSEGEEPPIPTMILTLTDAQSKEPNAKGSVKLEKLVWDYLYGPEAFVTSSDKPFILTTFGRPVAVASVTLEN